MKDCIIIDNKVKDWGSIEHLNFIHNMAVVSDRDFNREKYKWTLGSEIYFNLENMLEKYTCSYTDTKCSLFGIDVDIDMKNPTAVKLWKDVTEGQ